ncbi:hypothetical protein SALBM135S_07018 [Streptomyces alboniger]
MADDELEEQALERGRAVKEFAAKWRDQAWRFEALKTAGGWVVSGLVRELVSCGLSFWWGP